MQEKHRPQVEFQTPAYQGVWLPFDGDRMTFRKQVESYLCKKLSDPSGRLEFEKSDSNSAPMWRGKIRIELSYSHTQNCGLLIFSTHNFVGVDIEANDRLILHDSLKVARRFFHPDEADCLRKFPPEMLNQEFLKIWLKKEAYAKMTKKGLSQTIHLPLHLATDAKFIPTSLTPVNFASWICLQPLT